MVAHFLSEVKVVHSDVIDVGYLVPLAPKLGLPQLLESPLLNEELIYFEGVVLVFAQQLEPLFYFIRLGDDAVLVRIEQVFFEDPVLLFVHLALVDRKERLKEVFVLAVVKIALLLIPSVQQLKQLQSKLLVDPFEIRAYQVSFGAGRSRSMGFDDDHLLEVNGQQDDHLYGDVEVTVVYL